MKSPTATARMTSLAEMTFRIVQLRWWMIGGLSVAVLLAPTFLDISLPWQPLLVVLALLAVFNVLSAGRASHSGYGNLAIAAQLGVDLAALTVMLYLTGGATNPLVSLLLLPVAMAALSLPVRWAGGIAALAVGLYTLLMIKSLPLSVPDVERATRLHLGGMWLTFVVSASLFAWFMSRMMAAIRERDSQLAAARENSLRDAQVLALGQLAAGAAHELGTPLATMKILADEMTLDPRLPQDARDDLVLLQQQVKACKDIVASMTRRTGIDRAGEQATVRADHWLEGLLARWRTLWPAANCQFEIRSEGPVPVVQEVPTLEQAIVNLLNNAARATPEGLRLALSWDERWLRVAVVDRGPGFTAEVLASGGTQPLEAHEGGTGLGLWLTSSAVSRLGGKLLLSNERDGACAKVEMPRMEMVFKDGPNE